MKHIWFFTLSILLIVCKGFSQESDVKVNHEGKDFTKLKHAWTAQWITHPTESTLEDRKFLFRRTFNLNTMPKTFIIYVSADNRYRLYVNGEYVVTGPSVSDINNYRYETLDIAKYLKKGKNVIATEVVNFGEYRKASTMSFQTAFILQGDKKNVVDINTGKNSDWKVIRDYGFKTIPFVSDSLRGYYAAGPGEQLISKDHNWGWKKTNFDDSKWKTPKLATVEFAVGRGFLFGSTWYLTPRVIPFMEEKQQRFGNLARNIGIKKSENFIKGTGSLTIPANTTVQLLVDQEYNTIGHPVLKYAKGKGSTIKMTYTEALYDKNWKKGNRNDLEGKHVLGYYDIIKPDGGDDRYFKPFGLKSFRFIQLDITTKDEPLVITDYYNVFTGYPFKENAVFKTKDKTLTDIWNTSWRTMRNSSTETFTDCPYYEQLQYIGDARIESMISLNVSGDDRLMRKAIEMFDNSRLPIGLTASRYPSYIVQVIPTFSLIWVDMVHDFHMYKEDEEFIKQYVPGMKTILDWWIRKVDHNNMPTQMDWWNFVDWAKDFKNGVPDGADNGHSTLIALQLVKTLQNASEVFYDLGYTEEAKKYSEIEKNIRKSVVEKCFVPEKGLFAETPKKKKFSQHTNILAILTNTTPQNEQKTLMQKILDDKSLTQTTIYFKYYLFEALHKTGMGDLYTSLLQNWVNQLNQGLTTFAETDIEPRSDCHAWSASPNYHFLKIIAGIYPKSKHFKEVMIAPHFNGLSSINASMPHPKGTIEVILNRKKNKVTGQVTLPIGITGIFKWKGKEIQLSGGKQKIDIR